MFKDEEDPLLRITFFFVVVGFYSFDLNPNSDCNIPKNVTWMGFLWMHVQVGRETMFCVNGILMIRDNTTIALAVVEIFCHFQKLFIFFIIESD
jgi:hypothetical protein